MRSRFVSAVSINNLHFLDALKEKFCDDAEIIFYGCHVASGLRGRQFLQAVSRRLGVKATAYTGKVRVFYKEGQRITIRPRRTPE
jgi:hypothetical protein